MDKDIIRQFDEMDTIPLNGRQRTNRTTEIDEDTESVGWVIGHDWLVIDVDVKNGKVGRESYTKLLEDHFDFEPEISCTTPSGGFHVYLKVPATHRHLRLPKSVDSYPDIDFLSGGNYVVIPGSVLPDGGEYVGGDVDFDLPDFVPVALIDQGYAYNNVKATDATEDDLVAAVNQSQWEEEDVRSMLRKLDPDIEHDSWRNVGMALHDWDTERGLTLWNLWSKKGDKYVAGECEKRWKSFSRGGVSMVP